jgi:hypothetical protein
MAANAPSIDANGRSFNDVRDRARVDAAAASSGNAAVILTFGQSNASNAGRGCYTPREPVFNFNLLDGQCYAAQDPLLGPTETGGNFATRLADMLIERGAFDSVLIAPIAVGGSQVAEWTPSGRYHCRLKAVIDGIRNAGLRFTHLLWHQGETDAAYYPDADHYRACFMDLHDAIRDYGVDAPLFVAQATVGAVPPVASIREAQRSVVDPARRIFAGPDTDMIGPEDRFDGCHMAESGLRKHAEMWLACILRENTRHAPAP